MSSPIIFLTLATLVAFLSMSVNRAITQARISADKAFWLVWLFLIWSAETVTFFPFFEYPYPVQPEARAVTLITFLASAVGFLFGSIWYSQARGGAGRLMLEVRIVEFVKRWQLFVAVIVLIIGTFEFWTNSSKYDTLLDLRRGSVEGDVSTSLFYTQFFYFAQAFVMFLGVSDGFSGRISRLVVAFMLAGLVFHNLSVGGRINIVVGPALYCIPFLVRMSLRDDWHSDVKYRVRRLFLAVGIAIFLLFSLIGLWRAAAVDLSKISTFEGFFKTVLFGIPLYVSDTFVSIPVHLHYARQAELPMGFFTFDAFYRFFKPVLDIPLPEPEFVFGHIYYRDTPAPWGWTQTNLIPRLVADFGEYFPFVLVAISAFVQWLSLYRLPWSILGVVIRSLMIFSSAYTILSASWFTAMNVYIVFYAVIIYGVARYSIARRRNVFGSATKPDFRR